jgi:hypothetical protein
MLSYQLNLDFKHNLSYVVAHLQQNMHNLTLPLLTKFMTQSTGKEANSLWATQVICAM